MTEETNQEAQPDQLQLTLNDLAAMKGIIDIAS